LLPLVREEDSACGFSISPSIRPKWLAGSNPLQTNYSLQKLLIEWGPVWGDDSPEV